jgi:MYXO-CTERM domain-containing protein
MLRSVFAVILGLLVIAATAALGLHLVGSLVPLAQGSGVFPVGAAPYLTGFAVIVTLACLAGGFVTYSVVPQRIQWNVGILAAMALLWALVHIVASAVPPTPQVFWYALPVALLAALGVLLGGRLRRRR